MKKYQMVKMVAIVPVLMLFVLADVSVARADVVFSENWAEYTVGQDPHVINPTVYKDVNSSGTNVYQNVQNVIGYTGDSTNVLHISAYSSASSYAYERLYAYFTPSSGDLTASIFVRGSGNAKDTTELRFTNASANVAVAAVVFNPGGNNPGIYVNDGYAALNKIATSYVADRWYNVQITMHIDPLVGSASTCDYSIYEYVVPGGEASLVGTVEGMTVINPTTAVKGLQMTTKAYAIDTTAYTEIGQITLNSVPEPATLGLLASGGILLFSYCKKKQL